MILLYLQAKSGKNITQYIKEKLSGGTETDDQYVEWETEEDAEKTINEIEKELQDRNDI